MKIIHNTRASERAPISLPTYHDCLALMAAHAMLPNIREHSFRVMQGADRLGQALAAVGLTLHLPLISTGALLHDIGKTACLGTNDNHAQLGADILASLGYPELAQVVKEHVRLSDEAADSRPLREAEVVNYADKRVLHTQVVTLAERFADLQVRYGRTPSARVRIAAMEIKTQALEEKLFAPLRLSPLELLQVNGEFQGSKFKIKSLNH
ncbi:MAG: HD domain-containing protein [Deltaproteobacteria bacterium]|nr:HD domain-containing protein [Deltaproteobacteria bacterium]